MHKHRRKLGNRFKIGTGVVAAMSLYVLSPGPVDALHDRGILPNGAYGVFIQFYGPLRWFTSKLPKPLHDAYNWYHTRWWFDSPWLDVAFLIAGSVGGAVLVWSIVRRINRKGQPGISTPFTPEPDFPTNSDAR